MANKTADEYLIYAFSDYQANLFGVNKWRFVGKDTNPQECLKQAQQLYTSKKYERIEVKKKSFDPKRNRYNLSTVEILGKGKKYNLIKIGAITLLLFAIIIQISINNFINF